MAHPKINFGNWHDKIGTSHENSSNREAPNKHLRGSKKYKEMIARDSKNTDLYKNLPFKFSKPPKRTRPRRDVYMACLNCGEVGLVNKYTAGKVCRSCQKYTSVGEDNTYQSEEELVAAIESQSDGN